MFAFGLGAWYLTTFLDRLTHVEFFERANLVCAIALPFFGVQFFRAFVGADQQVPLAINRPAAVVAAGLLLTSFTPLYRHQVFRGAIFVFVSVVLGGALTLVWAQAKSVNSRVEAARLRYLALVGTLATTFTLVDFLPYVGLEIPPVGTVLILVFLYTLSQSILRYRLLDLYELAGRLTVLTGLAFALASIFWVLVQLAGGRFFLHAVVAGFVVLLVFEPLRGKVESQIGQLFFRERYDLERMVESLRARLAHILETGGLVESLVAGFEQSRRITHAAIYLVDEELLGYALAGHVGPAPVDRIEIAPARPLLDRLHRDSTLVQETLEAELEGHRQAGEDREAETVYEIVQTLEAMNASLCLPIQGEDEKLYGLLTLRDDRLRDAFSPEEIKLLGGLSTQAAIAVENSQLYERLKERDRLAALGEMAAGLAHEIRNPLGSIKASAQFLEDSPSGLNGREFTDIIVEEVDRLNRVVSSFLDYARPSTGHPTPTNVNDAIRRTMQLVTAEATASTVRWSLDLDDSLAPVSIDVEKLRQVLINLVRNAVQAMDKGGELTVRSRQTIGADSAPEAIEILVEDTGPGIAPRVKSTLFVPFVTTKDRGTGLGLAISQRIVSEAGGRIEARSKSGVGTTFVVKLPVAHDAPA